MKITIAQLNPVVGDIHGNLRRIREVLSTSDTDLIVFSELYLVGYPPMDLLENKAFQEETNSAVQVLCQLSAEYPETGIICGLPTFSGEEKGRSWRNSALLFFRGRVLFQQDKPLLATEDVFDEARYFQPASKIEVVDFKGEKLGIAFYDETWCQRSTAASRGDQEPDAIKVLAAQGGAACITISASPYHIGKESVRYQYLQEKAKKYGIPIVYLNQVGANDELIFDGRSMVFDRTGKMILSAPAFQEYIGAIDPFASNAEVSYSPPKTVESIYQALVLGIRDYMRKTGFSRALLGLSGGIDSALVACLAVEAAGKENVLGISLPSPYSSRGSVEDSRILAQNLGMGFKVLPISEIFHTCLSILEKEFAPVRGTHRKNDLTEENLQARIRGDILMAFSNKFGSLLLATSNKSEMAVGYCTLYGDMCGGLSVLADVPKTMVYDLAHYINRTKQIIPAAIIEKPPSAELRPNQRDEETLPPYPVLDQILHGYIEEGLSGEDLIAQGFSPEVVQWVINAVGRSEYKRRQAAPVLRITSKGFGMGRRIPIAAKNNI